MILWVTAIVIEWRFTPVLKDRRIREGMERAILKTVGPTVLATVLLHTRHCSIAYLSVQVAQV